MTIQEQIKEKKVKVYDIMAQIEYLQQELQKTNQEIAQLVQQELSQTPVEKVEEKIDGDDME